MGRAIPQDIVCRPTPLLSQRPCCEHAMRRFGWTSCSYRSFPTYDSMIYLDWEQVISPKHPTVIKCRQSHCNLWLPLSRPGVKGTACAGYKLHVSKHCRSLGKKHRDNWRQSANTGFLSLFVAARREQKAFRYPHVLPLIHCPPLSVVSFTQA